jgi:hypothetical protein
MRLINEVFSSSKLLCACFVPADSSGNREVFGHREADSANTGKMKMDIAEYETSQSIPSASPFSASELDREIKLDINDVSRVYRLLSECGHEGVLNALIYALVTLTSEMPLKSAGLEDPIALKQYLITLALPALANREHHHIMRGVVSAVDNLPPLARRSLTNWLSTTTLDAYQVYLDVVLGHITVRMEQGSVEDARRAVKLLSLLFAAHPSFPSVPMEHFYNDAICDYMASVEARKREYKLWLNDLGTINTAAYTPQSRPNSGSLSSFISFPYVLSPGVKASVLELDAAVQMRQVHILLISLVSPCLTSLLPPSPPLSPSACLPALSPLVLSAGYACGV